LKQHKECDFYLPFNVYYLSHQSKEDEVGEVYGTMEETPRNSYRILVEKPKVRSMYR
jgi:protein gp37